MSIIEADQFFGTPITTYKRGPFSIRYAYARSMDLEQTNERGQDYLAFRVEPDRLAFAVCDGVSNSFLGGLAAQILGENLITWLWSLKKPYMDQDEIHLKNNLVQFLNSLKQKASEIINRRDLTGIKDDLVVSALQQRRARSGSQSNFVCGLIQAPTEIFPEGRIWLFWLGDARLQIWSDVHNRTKLLEADWSSKEGWSTIQGVHGDIHCFSGDARSINHVLAYSDGLAPFERLLSPEIADSQLNSSIKELKSSHNDDISFLHISVEPTLYDIMDDLTAELRAEKPAIIVEKEVVKKSIPGHFYAIAGAALFILSSVGFFIGLQMGSRQPVQTADISPTVEKVTFEPQPSFKFEITPTETLAVMPTETPLTTPTAENIAEQEIVAVLFNIIRQPFFLEKECTNLIDLGLDSQSNVELLVNDQFFLRGYPTINCQGEQSFEITADFPKEDWNRLNIQSIQLIKQE